MATRAPSSTDRFDRGNLTPHRSIFHLFPRASRLTQRTRRRNGVRRCSSSSSSSNVIPHEAASGVDCRSSSTFQKRSSTSVDDESDGTKRRARLRAAPLHTARPAASLFPPRLTAALSGGQFASTSKIPAFDDRSTAYWVRSGLGGRRHRVLFIEVW
jgi:hypothetical protein